MNADLYGEAYFAWQLQPNILGIPRGDRPSLYAYWIRYLRAACPLDSPVLDVGCGLGFFVKRLRKRYRAFGLDISRAALTQGRGRWNLTVLQADAQALPVRQEALGVLLAFDVLEHLPHPERLVCEAHRALKKNGIMVLSTPNPESLGVRWKKERWFAYRDRTHISIRHMGDWRRLFREVGFSIERDGTDLLWDPPYVHWLPPKIQKLLCITAQWALIWAFGFFPWRAGENYIAVLRKNQ